jgi:hypothetical protein
MTAVLERVPVDRISAEARDVPFGRTVLTVIAGILYGIGWLVGTTFTAFWRAVVWVAVAVKVGWQDARKPEAGERAAA